MIWLKYGSRSIKTSSKRYPALKGKSSFADKKSTEQTPPMANSGLRVRREPAAFVPRLLRYWLCHERYLSEFSELSIYHRVWLRSNLKYILLSLASSLRIKHCHTINLSVHQNANFDQPLLSYLFKAVDNTLKWPLFIFTKSSSTQFSQQSLLQNTNTNVKLVRDCLQIYLAHSVNLREVMTSSTCDTRSLLQAPPSPQEASPTLKGGRGGRGEGAWVEGER